MLGKLFLGAAAAAAMLLVGQCSHPAPKGAAQLQAARQAATVASSQDLLDRSAASAGERAAATAIQTLAASKEAEHAVQTAPGADQPIPADVLARFDAGVDGVWAPGPAAAGAQPAGGDPAADLGALRASGQDRGADRR